MKKYIVTIAFLSLLIASRVHADFQTSVGSFAEPTSTGNAAITGVGFTPKAVIFWMNERTSDGSGADAAIGLGFATAAAAGDTISGAGNDNDAGSPFAYSSDNRQAIELVYGDQSSQIYYGKASLVSMDANGFTLNWGTVNQVASTSPIINYLAIGGTDITNATSGELLEPSATGTQAITGLGFKPDFIVAIYNDLNSSTFPKYGGALEYGWSFAASSSQQQAIMGDEFTSGAQAKLLSAQEPWFTVEGNFLGIFSSSTLQSFDSDGFTLKWGKVEAGTYHVQYLALKGGQYSVGALTQPTSTGNQSVSGIGFQPSATMFSSWNLIADPTGRATSTNNLSFGAAVSSSSRSSIYSGIFPTAALANSNASENLDRTKVLRLMTVSSSAPTTQATADFVSNDASGFTINWGSVDTTPRQVIYATLGANAAVSSTAAASPPPGISLGAGTVAIKSGKFSLP